MIELNVSDEGLQGPVSDIHENVVFFTLLVYILSSVEVSVRIGFGKILFRLIIVPMPLQYESLLKNKTALNGPYFYGITEDCTFFD